MIEFSSYLAKSCDFRRNEYPPDLDDDLSSAMATETLLAHDLVPEGLPASSKEPAEQQIHHIGGKVPGSRAKCESALQLEGIEVMLANCRDTWEGDHAHWPRTRR